MIRLMQHSDLQKVVDIENQVQAYPWSSKQFVEAIQNYQTTVIEKNAEVVGFCILQPVLDEANLLLMAIDPKYQGQGLGFELLDQSIAQLKNNPIQIFLEVRQSNQAAIRLYEKAGFHQIDLRKNYYLNRDGTKEHAIIMVKTCHDDFASLFRAE